MDEMWWGAFVQTNIHHYTSCMISRICGNQGEENAFDGWLDGDLRESGEKGGGVVVEVVTCLHFRFHNQQQRSGYFMHSLPR